MSSSSDTEGRRTRAIITHFARDADRIMRFEREARTLAALSHPNIAITHGLEQTAAAVQDPAQ